MVDLNRLLYDPPNLVPSHRFIRHLPIVLSHGEDFTANSRYETLKEWIENIGSQILNLCFFLWIIFVCLFVWKLWRIIHCMLKAEHSYMLVENWVMIIYAKLSVYMGLPGTSWPVDRTLTKDSVCRVYQGVKTSPIF